jgi:hypothetical protein
MPKFWLDNFLDLFSIDNFKLNDSVKLYNVLSLVIIIVGLVLVFKTKKMFYFGISIILLSIIIVLQKGTSKFTQVGSELNKPVSNQFYLNTKLLKNASVGANQIYVDNSFNIKQGDIILLDNGVDSESKLVVNVSVSLTDNFPVILFYESLKNNYSINNTKLFKVSNVLSDTLPPPDGNKSILNSNNTYVSSPEQMALNRAPNVVPLNNGNRSDINLELASYKGPGETSYQFQGPPNGPLNCRKSTINNPMGTVNITEFGATPTMYGTCNVGDTTVLPDGRTVNNDYLMTDNMESTVSMRVNDLLFHKGNAQSRFSPMVVDTIPDNQEAFAHFCYRSPTNLVNPKYASIFVNDPEKFKLVTQLAKATGTEGGGGGGGGGRGH